MKKKLLFLSVLLLLPMLVNATISNSYDKSKEYSNVYINGFKNNEKYILKTTSSFSVPFIYNDKVFSVNNNYKNGGLLNRFEFLVSKSKDNDTYLFTGNKYWTLTEDGTKVYMIDNNSDNISLQDKTSLSGTRIVEYIKAGTGVEGSGSYIDPWTFVERFKVTARSSNSSAGSVSPSEEYVNRGESITFKITPSSEYEYESNDCNGLYSNNKITILNIQSDKNCTISFKKKTYKLTYNNNGGSGCSSKTALSGNAWGTLCPPTRTNYIFLGWYTSSSGGTQITSSSIATKNQTVYAHWQYASLRLTYNNNGGNGCYSKTFIKDQAVGTLCTPSKDANEFDGWYTSATGGTKVTNTTILSEATTIYAHWTPICFSFTASTGTITNYYDYKGNDSSNGSCSRSVTIPSTISGKTVLKIGSSSFYEKNITSVTFPNTIDEISYSAFAYNQISSLVIPSSVKIINSSAFTENNISSLTLNEGLEYIGYDAFYKNRIQSVKVPSTVTTIEGYAFAENNISSLTLNNTIKSIGNFAFYKNRIPNVTIPKTVTYLGNASFNDNQLPDGIATLYKRNSDGSEDKTTVVSYGGSRRYNVVVPSTVKTIDDWAYYYNNITSITIPDSVTKVGNHAVAFNDLSTINIPESVTYIDRRGFANNWASTINYNSSKLTYLGNAAFNGNSTSTTNALKFKKNSDGTDDTSVVVSYSANRANVTLPNTVKEIADLAFFNAFIYSISIPEGVTYIGSEAFGWCYLSNVTIPSTVKTIGGYSFSKYYDNNWSENLNPLYSIVNKTGKAFEWGRIINSEYYYNPDLGSDYYLNDYNFETGTVKNPRGNVTITK